MGSPGGEEGAAPLFGANAKALIIQAALAEEDAEEERRLAERRQGERRQRLPPAGCRLRGASNLHSARFDSIPALEQCLERLSRHPCAHRHAWPLLPGPPPPDADAAAAAAAEACRRGAEYLAAVDVKQRPLVAFINRAKIPRINRQACAVPAARGCCARRSRRPVHMPRHMRGPPCVAFSSCVSAAGKPCSASWPGSTWRWQRTGGSRRRRRRAPRPTPSCGVPRLPAPCGRSPPAPLLPAWY